MPRKKPSVQPAENEVTIAETPTRVSFSLRPNGDVRVMVSADFSQTRVEFGSDVPAAEWARVTKRFAEARP